MVEEQQASPRTVGAHGEQFTHYVALFSAVFVAGFVVVAVVLMTRRRKN